MELKLIRSRIKAGLDHAGANGTKSGKPIGRQAAPVDQLETDLATLRAEQKRRARLLAKLDDAPEIEAEYSARTGKIRSLESAIATAKAAPGAARIAVETIAGEIGAVFTRLRAGLVAAPDDARQALRALFPRGIYFAPDGKRWALSGRPEPSAIVDALAFATPTGWVRITSTIPFEILLLRRPEP